MPCSYSDRLILVLDEHDLLLLDSLQDCFEVLKDLLSKHQTIILAVGLSSLFSTVVALFLTGSFIVLR